ncbi:hypothetical protein Tco_0004466 [Tanacetum coccineum]
MTFISQALLTSFLDSCFISSTVSEDKRVMNLCISRFVLMQEHLVYMNDTTMMLTRFATIHGENVYIRDLIDFDVTESHSRDRDVGLGGSRFRNFAKKGVYEESFSRHAAWIGGKLIQFMHTTMVPVQVKTMKIQAGIQVSRPRELTRQLQL